MKLPYAWRVTKYNPALRNPQGHYLAPEWTAFAEIGEFFAGKQFTYADYLLYENAYATSVMAFLSEAGLSSLRVSELENRNVARPQADGLRDIICPPSLLALGSTVDIRQLEDVVRLNLREILWCKLTEENRFYLHFGWDYYMYIGSTSPSHAAI